MIDRYAHSVVGVAARLASVARGSSDPVTPDDQNLASWLQRRVTIGWYCDPILIPEIIAFDCAVRVMALAALAEWKAKR